ncbi:hypothetical protein EX30DRAFT_359517 [Ascodesmis nigricans]|uniref:Phenol 2-monooxygenase n=1 Tax=Ascodesmis nigricans TaxID=341454 RepID=A0A4S2MSW6_9PEZI|nr:hypothetical protein EX30DRAFT_359517 [Ascodesmis nigricans]
MAATAAQKSSDVDVLIVGAGPAGFMSATWLSNYTGLKVRFVEKRNTKVFAGQADGLQCRTLEVFQSFGMAQKALNDANHMWEICFWDPEPETGIIKRTARIPDMTPGISRFTQVVLHQGNIEQYFIDYLKEHGDNIKVERGVLPESISIDESKVDDNDAYPVKVTLRHLPEEAAEVEQFGHKVQNGLFRSANLMTEKDDDKSLNADTDVRETINCKYVIGCDGAHSWVRRQLGYKMEGEHTDYVWGVLDIVPLTDFPDIRHRCAIHSENNGSVMVIPRENGLVRLYIQLSDVERLENGMVDRSKITPEIISKCAQSIIAPYKLTYEKISWFTAYQIGQRVCNNFSANDRVFLAGDACHTHSPKAGQGMNISMMDTYNLGWKIGSVLTGRSPRNILKTYQYERRQIANDLINFDRKFAKLFSGKPGEIDLEEFQKVFAISHLFASGTGVEYDASNLIAKDPSTAPNLKEVVPPVVKAKDLAAKIPVGQRFMSYKAMNQSDARVWHLQDVMPSDGRWRFLVFAGNIKDAEQNRRVQKLGEYLARPDAFTYKYTPEGAEYNSAIQTLTVHCAPRTEVELDDFPRALRPEHDYWSLYVDDVPHHEPHTKCYEQYGVDPKRGCVVVIRPDGYVGYVGDLEDTEEVEKYFSQVLIPQRK